MLFSGAPESRGDLASSLLPGTPYKGVYRHFAFTGPQTVILPERPTRFKRKRPPSPQITKTLAPARIANISIPLWHHPRCIKGGGTPNRWMRSRIAANKSRGTATTRTTQAHRLTIDAE